MGVLLFLSTLSFPFTTPGVTVASVGGFPVLSVPAGQFLLMLGQAGSGAVRCQDDRAAILRDALNANARLFVIVVWRR